MGDCILHFEEIRVSTRKPDITEAWVYIRGEGDCPFQVIGWRYHAFPLDMTVIEILSQLLSEKIDPLDWPRMDPPPTEPNYNPDWDSILASIESKTFN